MLLVQDKDENEAFKIASVTVRIKWPANHQSRIQPHITKALLPSSFRNGWGIESQIKNKI